MEFILCFLSSSDEWADVSTPVANADPSSDGRMMLACPVATRGHNSDGRMISSCMSLLCYHCSDGQAVAYGLFLQWCVVVVGADYGGVLFAFHSNMLEGWGSIGPKLGLALRVGTGNGDTFGCHFLVGGVAVDYA
jgi:hypothetical protein